MSSVMEWGMGMRPQPIIIPVYWSILSLPEFLLQQQVLAGELVSLDELLSLSHLQFLLGGGRGRKVLNINFIPVCVDRR